MIGLVFLQRVIQLAPFIIVLAICTVGMLWLLIKVLGALFRFFVDQVEEEFNVNLDWIRSKRKVKPTPEKKE